MTAKKRGMAAILIALAGSAIARQYYMTEDQASVFVGEAGDTVVIIDSTELPAGVSDGSTTGMVRLIGVDGALARTSLVTTTNDAEWVGWNCTGELTTNGYIMLNASGEWLESPVLANGILSYDESAIYSDGSATMWLVTVYTNTTATPVDLPYTGTDARLRIEWSAFQPPIGFTGVNGVKIPSFSIAGFANPSLIGSPDSYVGQHKITHSPTDPEQVARLDTVLTSKANAMDYTDIELTGYDRDTDKVLRGSVMRLTNGWQFAETGINATNRTLAINAGAVAMLELDADITWLTISDVVSETNDVFTLAISTNGAVAMPLIEISYDVIQYEWEPANVVSNSYPTLDGSNYIAQIDVGTNATFYLRALQEIASVITVKADVLDLGGTAILSNAVDVVTSGGKSLSGAAMAADLGTAAYLDEGDVVLSTTNSITVSGLETATRTYTPTAEVYYVECPFLNHHLTIVGPLANIFSTYNARTFDAANDRAIYNIPPGATRVIVRGYMEETGAAATNGAAIGLAWINIDPATVRPPTGATTFAYTNMIATNTLFTLWEEPVAGTASFPGSQLHVFCAATNATITAIQPFSVLSVTAEIPVGNTATTLGTLIKDVQREW